MILLISLYTGKYCLDFHIGIHQYCNPSLFASKINFWAKTCKKFAVTLTPWSKLEAFIMSLTASVYIINRFTRSTTTRPTPFIAWKNTKTRSCFSPSFYIQNQVTPLNGLQYSMDMLYLMLALLWHGNWLIKNKAKYRPRGRFFCLL
jgi:hypothetical protein